MWNMRRIGCPISVSGIVRSNKGRENIGFLLLVGRCEDKVVVEWFLLNGLIGIALRQS